MKVTQVPMAPLWLCVGLFSSLPAVCGAADGFSDDFMDANPTNPSRQPVAWRHVFEGSIAIENGDLIVGSSSGLSGAFVEGFTATNLSIETQFRILQGTNAGIGLRVSEASASDCYFGDLNSTQAGLFRCGATPLGNGVPVNFDATQEDTKMRLQAVGDQLSLWVWPADEARPIAPTTTARHSALIDGGVGVYVDSAASGPTQAVFRYFNVTVIPEPSTAILAIAGVVTSLLLIRNRTAGMVA